MYLDHQQLTYYNNKEVEIFLRKVLKEVSLVFEKIFTKETTSALILIGGYGRGEGGILVQDDAFHPHNDLNILYIHHGSIDNISIDKANRQLEKISKTYTIDIDMSAINKNKLLNLNGLVMSYDMRYGHKTLLGNSDFLKEYQAFSIENIDPIEVRQLLVNRGTLLLINRLLLNKETLLETEKRLIIKHTMKAIIGYGDALLYFNNAYHWSYAQKQSNLSHMKNISKDIKDLYSEAILFRFMPDYDVYLDKDLKTWNKELFAILSRVHLECEQVNLIDSDLDWDNYLTIALENKSYPRHSIPQKIKATLHGLRYLPVIRELKSRQEKLSFMQLGGKAMLALLFPYIAYQTYPKRYHGLFYKTLQFTVLNDEYNIKIFLKLWAKWGDINFINVLNTYNIQLEK